MSEKVIYAAILGAGTVGMGTYKLCEAMSDEIKHKTGARLVIKKVLVRNMAKKREGIPKELLTDDWAEIITDTQISIIVELMGGIHPAKDYVLDALKAGKQVVTANKDLIAEYGEEVGNAANAAGADLQFEAAVAGAIPIIRPLKQSMTGNHITEIMGIVNGTTNYILTKMTESGMDYAEALAKATELGYAEADPTADVEGYDACRKIAILTSLAYGQHVDYEDIYTEGITAITDVDFKYASKMGRVIKLFGKSKRVGDKFFAMVAPFMIDDNDPLYSVNGVLNGILVKGNVLGDVMFYGSGAGKLPTASAVVSDVVDAAKHKNTHIMQLWSSKKLELSDIKSAESRFFVRVSGTADARLEDVTAVFGDVEVISVDGVTGEFGFVTKLMTEADYEKAAAQVEGIITRIRVE